MPIKIRELDEKTGKPKQKMPLPKPKPRHANPKHPMNTERTGPLRKAEGGTVKVGEKGTAKTLSQIAKQNGVTLKSLLAANPSIKNANMIRLGQSIKIPGATAGAGAKSSNPYAGMTKTQMNMMDVKNKDTRKQQAVTRGMQAQGKMSGQRTPTKTSKNPQLDELRSRLKRAGEAKRKTMKAAPKKSAPSMSGMRDDDVAAYKGGAMKKKVQGYKSGGMCRGGGAATKGRRYGRSG